jgi:hypothetical protein
MLIRLLVAIGLLALFVPALITDYQKRTRPIEVTAFPASTDDAVGVGFYPVSGYTITIGSVDFAGAFAGQVAIDSLVFYDKDDIPVGTGSGCEVGQAEMALLDVMSTTEMRPLTFRSLVASDPPKDCATGGIPPGKGTTFSTPLSTRDQRSFMFPFDKYEFKLRLRESVTYQSPAGNKDVARSPEKVAWRLGANGLSATAFVTDETTTIVLKRPWVFRVMVVFILALLLVINVLALKMQDLKIIVAGTVTYLTTFWNARGIIGSHAPIFPTLWDYIILCSFAAYFVAVIWKVSKPVYAFLSGQGQPTR